VTCRPSPIGNKTRRPALPVRQRAFEVIEFLAWSKKLFFPGHRSLDVAPSRQAGAMRLSERKPCLDKDAVEC
jgi:hypothetical protein